MNLSKRAINSLSWYRKLLLNVFRVNPSLTLITVTASGIGLITKLLAFLLPLKVILLAGSEGVPRYFQFFISPDDKWSWVVGLAIGAVASYVITLLLEALTERLSIRGGTKVMALANQMTFIRNQADIVSGYYGKVTEFAANIMFVFSGCLVIGILRPDLLASLFTLVFLQYVFTGLVVSDPSKLNFNLLKSYVERNYKAYLKNLVSVNFLIGFLVVLSPYIVGSGPNILVSLVAFIVMRQSLNALAHTFKLIIGLRQDRLQVDALFFPQIQLEKPEGDDQKVLRDTFIKSRRLEILSLQLQKEDLIKSDEEAKLVVKWADSGKADVNHIYVYISSNPRQDQNKKYLVQVYLPKRHLYPEWESFLFSYIERKELWAPELISSFEEGRFKCQLKEITNENLVPANRWREAHIRILQKHMQTQLPLGLLNAYRQSQPMMAERFSNDLLDRLNVALDERKEEIALRETIEVLPKINKFIEQMPCYVLNPDLKRKNVVGSIDGEGVQILQWGSWSLEPVGAGIPDGISEGYKTNLINTVLELRKDIPSWINLEHVKLINEIYNVEDEISKGRLKSALKLLMKASKRYDAL